MMGNQKLSCTLSIYSIRGVHVDTHWDETWYASLFLGLVQDRLIVLLRNVGNMQLLTHL